MVDDLKMIREEKSHNLSTYVIAPRSGLDIAIRRRHPWRRADVVPDSVQV